MFWSDLTKGHVPMSYRFNFLVCHLTVEVICFHSYTANTYEKPRSKVLFWSADNGNTLPSVYSQQINIA